MCGRFTLKTRPEVLAEHFELSERPGVEPRYNIAPTQPVAVVRAGFEGGRELSLLRWGLIPPWTDDPAIGNRMINARAETAAGKPAYRSAFRFRRCLVLESGDAILISAGIGLVPRARPMPRATAFSGVTLLSP